MLERTMVRAFSSVVLAILTAGIAWGQAPTTGTIVGAVKDPSGSAIPDVSIAARHVDTGPGKERRIPMSVENSFSTAWSRARIR
jgi:hypothetical protein